MRIDIGPEGEVIATKKITANGTVSGLKAHAGKEVLIVSSHGPATYRTTHRERAASAVRSARAKFDVAKAKAMADGGPVETVRRRTPPVALKAMDNAQKGLDKARAWMESQRLAIEARAEEARAKAQAARQRVEAKAEGAKGDIEARAKKLRESVGANATRRRQDIEHRIEAVKRDIESRWQTGRREVGLKAQRLRERVKAQTPQDGEGRPTRQGRKAAPAAAAPGVN